MYMTNLFVTDLKKTTDGMTLTILYFSSSYNNNILLIVAQH